MLLPGKFALTPSSTTAALAAMAAGAVLLFAAAAPSRGEDSTAVARAIAPCAAATPVIDLTVEGVGRATGVVVADLHGDNPKHFLKKGKKLKRVRTPAIAGKVRLCIPVERPGTYAVAVYHDRNGNRRFDKSWIGLPSEPFGVSNNPEFVLGPPSFEDSAFRVSRSGAHLTIKLRD